MSSPIKLIGLDFGSTTSSAVAAVTSLQRNPLSARIEVADVSTRWHSPLVFTPFEPASAAAAASLGSSADALFASARSSEPLRLALPQLEALLDHWLEQVASLPGTLFGGGALVTGLAARAPNASALTDLVRARLGEALIAPVGDPCLESWMAFMGSVAPLSRAIPEQAILHLDIGGGTTNLALGCAGDVLHTGCLFVGARHLRFEPGTYRLRGCSEHGEALLRHLALDPRGGETLSNSDVTRILDFYLALLRAACGEQHDIWQQPVAALHQQVALTLPAEFPPALFTFSGGVGELMAARLRGEPPLGVTPFGDLGTALAERLLADPFFSSRMWEHSSLSSLCGAPSNHRFALDAPQRATVLGLLQHATHVSGATLYVSQQTRLPLRDVPILGRLDEHSPAELLDVLFRRVASSAVGGCLQLRLDRLSPARLSAFASRLRQSLLRVGYPAARPLVLLTQANLGKVLGGFMTRWGQEPWTLLVLDELEPPSAQFLQVGRPHGAVVPVSFYGMTV